MSDMTVRIADARQYAEDIEQDGLYDLSPKYVAEEIRVLAHALESSLAENERLRGVVAEVREFFDDPEYDFDGIQHVLAIIAKAVQP